MSLSVIPSDKRLSQALCQSVCADAGGTACCEVSDIEEMSNLFMAVEKYSGSWCSAVINQRKREKRVLDCVLCCGFRRY